MQGTGNECLIRQAIAQGSFPKAVQVMFGHPDGDALVFLQGGASGRAVAFGFPLNVRNALPSSVRFTPVILLTYSLVIFDWE